MGFLTFNSTSSTELGVVIERYPQNIHASKRVHAYQIPGRSGDLTISDGAYNNYVQPYEVYFKGAANNMPEVARAVAAWLNAPVGYVRLADSYEPDVFRLAMYKSQTDIENFINRFGRCTIEFECAPQRFLLSGETVQEFTSGGVIANPTAFPALPLIRVYGVGTVTINGTTLTINQMADGASYTDIDCEAQNCYFETVNCNSFVTVSEFPKLTAGNNAVDFDGVSKVEITPRWWTI